MNQAGVKAVVDSFHDELNSFHQKSKIKLDNPQMLPGKKDGQTKNV